MKNRYLYDILEGETVQNHSIVYAASLNEAHTLVQKDLPAGMVARLVQSTVDAGDPSADDTGFDYTFFASDREDAKGHADYPLTREYIDRLERITLAAMEVYRNPGDEQRSALYDALDLVNFLNEDL
jgi:hypothetical protein